MIHHTYRTTFTRPYVPFSLEKLEFNSAYSLRDRSGLWDGDKHLPRVTVRG